MIYSATIPASQVSETELIALVDQIKVVTKSDIKIELQFVIVTEDENLSGLLESLVDAVNAAEPSVRRNGHKPQKVKGKAEMTSHQVRIEQTGEIVSRQAFNKRLAAGEIVDLTNVTNAKGELFVVMDGELVKGPRS